MSFLFYIFSVKAVITFLLTLLPAILLFLYFYLSEKFKINKIIIIKVFIAGILITIPAGELNSFILSTFSNNNEINDALLIGFFAGGLVEELLKFSVLYFFVLKNYSFRKPSDAIIYGITCSLGFATLENFEYVYLYNGDYSNLTVASLRAISAIPLHGFNGIVMGFYFGFFAVNNNIKFLGHCILLPIIFHGTYNFLTDFNFLFAIFVLVIMAVFVRQLYKDFKINFRLTKNIKNLDS
jgi:RsiW-degrading membrane proteinase PrsW (M82 family)